MDVYVLGFWAEQNEMDHFLACTDMQLLLLKGVHFRTGSTCTSRSGR